jgi:hypothetical protein
MDRLNNPRFASPKKGYLDISDTLKGVSRVFGVLKKIQGWLILRVARDEGTF